MIYFIKIAFNRSKVSSYVKKKLYDPFLWMAFNCRKVRSTWIRAEGGCARVWEAVQNTFKGRGNCSKMTVKEFSFGKARKLQLH